jgi:hypothetical protein
MGSDYRNKRITCVGRVAGDEVTSCVFFGNFGVAKGHPSQGRLSHPTWAQYCDPSGIHEKAINQIFELNLPAVEDFWCGRETGERDRAVAEMNTPNIFWLEKDFHLAFKELRPI